MDSVNNAARSGGGIQSASSGTEPLSGQTGKGTHNQPYDAGNASGEPTNAATTGPPSSVGKASDSSRSIDRPSDSSTPNTSINQSITPASHIPSSSTSQGQGDTRQSTTALDGGKHDASTGADPKSAQQPTPKQQGADRPMEEPTGDQGDAIRSSKSKAEAAMNDDDTPDPKTIKRDPNDHSGEPMHDHGVTESKGQRNQDDGPSQEKGTGKLWVKSTGEEADGGDFDASKPGAAREADRILEQKGIHHEENKGPPQKVDSKDAHDPLDKPGMGSKIKEKLHLGHKEEAPVEVKGAHHKHAAPVEGKGDHHAHEAKSETRT